MTPFTFLFADLENSTQLWERQPVAMRPALARHDALLQAAVTAHDGRVVKTTGDGLHAVFASAERGAAAALAGQQALLAEPWPEATGALRARMGLHTGESDARDGDYYGPEVNRAARVAGAAHGGQIVVSEATAGLLRHALAAPATLADLGQHRLKGLSEPERIYQLCHPNLPADFPELNSLAAFKHNLPPQLSSFIGRDKELAEVRRLLSAQGGARLLTLLGPGGTGKTRLMLQAAEELVDQYPDGVWLVELAPLTDPGLIGERVAAALGVQEQPGRPIRDALVDYLRLKRLLLLLDNVEHLVRESAALAEHLLARCPKLTLLVTGREALFIAGETTLQIPSLELPVPGERSAQAIACTEAAQLFLVRARSVKPDFAFTPANAPAIADILRRLDGIPLALELAAARLRMFTVDQISQRLYDRFRLLTGGRRTALPRQQTLQALIEWSWNLLDEPERILLRRLSVFSGGWTLEAAQAVASGDPLDEFAVVDLMAQLINKSLVNAHLPPEGAARYNLLESIRQFAQERLIEAGEGEALRNRHAETMTALAESVSPLFLENFNSEAIQRMLADMDNLKAVVDWSFEARLDLALRICSSLFYGDAYWLTPRELTAWLEPVVEAARGRVGIEGVEARHFIRVLSALGLSYLTQGQVVRAREILAEANQTARQAGEQQLLPAVVSRQIGVLGQSSLPLPVDIWDSLREAIDLARQHGLLVDLAMLHSAAGSLHALRLGDFAAAAPYLSEFAALAAQVNSPRANLVAAINRGLMAAMQGCHADASAHYAAAVKVADSIGDRRIGLMARSDLAHAIRRRGDLPESEAHYRRNILAWQEVGHQPAVAHSLECIAYLAIAAGRHTRAAHLLGAAADTRERVSALSTNPLEVAEHGQALAQLAAVLGDTERDRLMEEGRRISLDDAVLLALARD